MGTSQSSSPKNAQTTTDVTELVGHKTRSTIFKSQFRTFGSFALQFASELFEISY